MSFEIKPATRVGMNPIIGLYGLTGSGKTLSALLLARGIVGEQGRIILVDSESGRGSLFADMVPGGYDVIEIDPPFSPARFQEAIETAARKADIVVVDTLSHEHAGEGGVLDMQEDELTRMAGTDYQKREACKMASWIKPKMAHKKFLQRLLRLKCGVICCLRGEEKTHMVKEGGRNKVVTDDFSTPIFDPKFMFELLLCLECYRDEAGRGGNIVARKITHPTLEATLPKKGEKIGIATGQAITRWCAAPGANATADVADKWKAEAWAKAKAIHGGDAAKFRQHLVDEALIDPDTQLKDVTSANWKTICAKL